ncbi:helicase-exonuclease AddAB subunit AddA [Paenibacillus turpanensis]|uniref:helicase-exonuclease AddAB subunit AddA n=1 Tax=Paenibacillus turpanensis TaxID=2689078 RepID=UPI00140C23A6|nr:helicase-exonuclease AddAB subunit AddA [Paenibacillus turpanensis]
MTSANQSNAAGPKWTDDQWNAITVRDTNLLVAAAAGSGKTAVLVERLIRRITDPDRPTDVDRLLVATFTKAAADEMRHRIRDALEKALERTPESRHIRKQLAVLNRASITTLHSFCMEILQRYSHVIGLDPGFRIANETEAALLRQEVLGELFEGYYGENGEESGFWRLAESFGGERGDEELYALVERLYDFSRSHPWPDYWLSEMAGQFLTDGGNQLWMDSLIEDIALELDGMQQHAEQALALCRKPGGPAPYAAAIQEDLDMLARLTEQATARSWDGLYAQFAVGGFAAFKRVKADETDARLQEQVKALREQVKKQWKALKDQLFDRPPEAYLEEVRALAPDMELLARIVKEFSAAYSRAKSEKGLLDFSDLEHFALEILRDPSSEPDRLQPSEAALSYREQFDEVMLDEYQDTNRVQETIVWLLSREGTGNRFMVGDVKQSIYKFRLAEPELFMEKYRTYGDGKPKGQVREAAEQQASGHGLADFNGLPTRGTNGEEQALSGAQASSATGRRIDLARNFRSRAEVVDAVNFIFKQIMHERAAEMDYDERAELVCGAEYPDPGFSGHDLSTELLLVDRDFGDISDGEASVESSDSAETEETAVDRIAEEARELETAQLEARLIAERIRALMGQVPGIEAMRVADRKQGLRPIQFRDIVILMRATEQWAPVFMEELRMVGIPSYAELSTGYFAAVEVEVVISLLQTIDNPLQDIPLAAVLRSPVAGLTADELARIRLADRKAPYYEAAAAFVASEENRSELQDKLGRFLEKLSGWRTRARQGSLADLIWQLYRETGYYDFVGGLPGGTQRQANLRALYDRARQFETTSMRGLFRFLRFIERMKESGSDLGAARALGEQEDVVRIMTIHKSKGLEFPVVFVAGMGKKFNEMDLNGNFLLHKRLGFGPRYTDSELRISYPSLPAVAIKRRLRREMLAEEMRVLYVALTRAKEKLILCGTLQNAAKQLSRWSALLSREELQLPGAALLGARSYLDWLGASLIRHPDAAVLREAAAEGSEESAPAGTRGRLAEMLHGERSRWLVGFAKPEMLAQAAVALSAADPAMEAAVARVEPVPAEELPEARIAAARLEWAYSYPKAPYVFSKTTISEMKRRFSERENEEEAAHFDLMRARSVDKERKHIDQPHRRPKFLEAQSLTAAERGIAYHTVMQLIPLDGSDAIDSEKAVEALDAMVEKRLLTKVQREAVDPALITSFFATPIGQRLLSARDVRREVPFSLGLPAEEVYGQELAEQLQGETVLVQGVIDCLFQDEQGLVLLDFKTDAVYGGRLEELRERYRLQLSVYRKAVEIAWKREVTESYLFFFNGAHLIEMNS